MNEEEKSNLYIYTYSDLDDDFVFAETKYTLGDLHKLQQELQKYKSLYQNEKEHTDTLKRIIKKIGEYVEELYDNTDDIICYDIDKNCKRDILDLLKEIK